MIAVDIVNPDHCCTAVQSNVLRCVVYQLSWLRTVAPNIHPNVDGEVAYAAPINGLAVGYIQV